ncbi:unnamed protein product, partial [Meganyctiphanes norvegica]
MLGHLKSLRGSRGSNLALEILGPLKELDLSILIFTKNAKFPVTVYFIDKMSPPTGDDAECSSGRNLYNDGSDLELTCAQLTRQSLSPAKTPTKEMNGHVQQSVSPPKRSGLRSQIDKEESLGKENMITLNKREATQLTINCQESTAPTTRSSTSHPSTPNSPTPNNVESPQSGGPSTPHKIQALNEERLRLDSPLSPSSAFSKLKLSGLTPKKLSFNGKKIKQTRKKPPAVTISRGQLKCDKLAPKTTLAASLTTNTSTTTKSSSRIANNLTKTTSMAPRNNSINGEVKTTLRATQMTEFFPIRRSDRKPKTKLLEERQKDIEEKILSGSEEGLCIADFGAKGRGIVTTRPFKKGEFVVEYIGELIDMREAKNREERYAMDASKGCYSYYFCYQDTQYCIDATEESPYLGRLVNHSRNGNLVTKTVEVNGRPRLVLIAKKDVDADTEVMYDYGDRSKESLEHHPWLDLV